MSSRGQQWQPRQPGRPLVRSTCSFIITANVSELQKSLQAEPSPVSGPSPVAVPEASSPEERVAMTKQLVRGASDDWKWRVLQYLLNIVGASEAYYLGALRSKLGFLPSTSTSNGIITVDEVLELLAPLSHRNLQRLMSFIVTFRFDTSRIDQSFHVFAITFVDFFLALTQPQPSLVSSVIEGPVVVLKGDEECRDKINNSECNFAVQFLLTMLEMPRFNELMSECGFHEVIFLEEAPCHQWSALSIPTHYYHLDSSAGCCGRVDPVSLFRSASILLGELTSRGNSQALRTVQRIARLKIPKYLGTLCTVLVHGARSWNARRRHRNSRSYNSRQGGEEVGGGSEDVDLLLQAVKELLYDATTEATCSNGEPSWGVTKKVMSLDTHELQSLEMLLLCYWELHSSFLPHVEEIMVYRYPSGGPPRCRGVGTYFVFLALSRQMYKVMRQSSADVVLEVLEYIGPFQPSISVMTASRLAYCFEFFDKEISRELLLKAQAKFQFF